MDGTAQRGDPTIRKIFGQLMVDLENENANSVVVQNFMVVRGFLFRRTINEVGKLNLRYFVPKQKVLGVLNKVHGLGHFMSDKLWQTLKLNYYWHGMYEDVMAFCSQCRICETKAKPAKQFVLQHVTAAEPFELLSMDLVELQSGHFNFLLTIMDVFSRFGFAVPLRNKRAESVMKSYLKSFVVIFGIPEKILTDRGKEFLADLAMEVYKSLVIKKLSTTVKDNFECYSPCILDTWQRLESN